MAYTLETTDFTETVVYYRSQCFVVAYINWLHGSTTNKYIFSKVKKTLTMFDVKWNRLKCATSEIAKNMCSTLNWKKYKVKIKY